MSIVLKYICFIQLGSLKTFQIWRRMKKNIVEYRKLGQKIVLYFLNSNVH